MIVCAGPADAAKAAALALELWPHSTQEELAEEFETLLSQTDCTVFLLETEDGPAGFAQCQLRHDYVEGTETSPVGYLEGIYVRPEYRRQGHGRTLLTACEQWAREQGCTEFASDCELENTHSAGFHEKLGFREARRIICFTKKL